MLDGGPNIQALAVTDLAEHKPISFVRLSAYSPELNPVEERWRELKTALGNRLFTSLDDLKHAINKSLAQLSTPYVGNYF